MAKVIIITGASRGIGAATAILAAIQGYSVVVNYKSNSQAANNVVDTIQKNGGRALAIAADVSQEAEVEKLFKTADKELGAVTALVNNVGILEKQMRLDAMGAERINRILTTNVTSYFLCAREAIKRMSTRYNGKGGAIVNVSSAASRLGSANSYIDYAASKGAVDTLTLGLAQEVADEGVRVNCVRPGFIYTDIHETGGEPDRVARIEKSLPMQRGGTPEEVANTILWLLSDEASYVTNTFIDVAGGR